jgi:hypothetical protein
MIDQLESIGIQKGKPFDPDARTQAILKTAASEAHAWLDLQYEASLSSPYFEGTHWAVPGSKAFMEGMGTFFENPNSYPIDTRGVVYSFIFFSPKHLGRGSFYLLAINDKDGKGFDGGTSYRLTVPANAPVTQFWSATIYDRETHALIRDLPRPSRSSQSAGLQTNSEGSVDIYFGPKAPAGKEVNWVPTSPGGKFEVLFRFFGPQKPLFDKTWKLPDIELSAAQ